MNTYSVLLESYKRLPHLELGKEVAELMGVHVQDAYTRLRRQEGIVWEGLERSQAEALGAFLIQRGHPAGLVADEDIVTLAPAHIVRNGAVIREGFEIVDRTETRRVIEPTSIALVQAGWVEEEVEVTRDREHVVVWQPRRDYSFNYTTRPVYETIGWILQVFETGEPAPCLRVMGSRFNYAYQEIDGANSHQRFGILMTDLAKVVGFERLDHGFRLCMGSGTPHPPDATYDSLNEMIERARWELTIRKVHG